MTAARASLVALFLLGLVVASPAFIEHVDSWIDVSESAFIAIGGSIVSGAILSLVVVEYEHSVEKRRTLEDEKRELERAQRDIWTATLIQLGTERRLSGIDLSGRDMHSFFLREADLTQSNLSDANLLGADLRRAKFDGASMQRADLRAAKLCDCGMEQADLTDANLEAASMDRIQAHGIRLRRVNLRSATLSDAILSGADLRDADLTDADLTGANLTGANLTGATFDKAALVETKLDRATGYRPSTNHDSSGSVEHA